MIVLDTHTLVWRVNSPDKLSQKAKKKLNEAARWHISAVSFWEIALLVKKGRIALAISLEDWLEKLQQLPKLSIIPLDEQIAIRSVQLPEPIHTDPADRFIIATAIEKQATLITKDQKMLDYLHVKTLW